ncbi:MAG TPA: hypothetical protein VKR22_03285 [Acidimicrobiales bacterium]|nr:hypothetical protein [Acidimicrobiales bacterium]
MADRAYRGLLPWDEGCAVVPMIGGFQAMNAMRNSFEAAIDDADEQAAKGVPVGRRGHVYMAGWQFNGLRDLSVDNPWGGRPWKPGAVPVKDQTALGLVIRMMAAGINVRLLLWMPTSAQGSVSTNLADEHWSVAAAVQDYNATLEKLWGLSAPLGVVALDLRIAAAWTATIHQKTAVVRVGKVNVAFCGGVDLAFTRRDYGRPPNAAIGLGDWQSGTTIPLEANGWPQQQPAPDGGYPNFPYSDGGQFPEDLPGPVYGTGFRHWHDHHLRLTGPIVTTLEEQFAERWIMSCAEVKLFDRYLWTGEYDEVHLTSNAAIEPGGQSVRPLPAPKPTAPAGNAITQMWRTIPLRPNTSTGPFARGEFTVMAGVAKAVAGARELITIWDHYFWSVPLARLLAAQLSAVSTLKLLIVLPPYGTTLPGDELALRKEALQALWSGLDDAGRARVLVRDMWAGVPGPNVGIYVHAKTQTYDDQLLVCGSANMNRRSFECDTELDCAVLHTPTVQAHLTSLYACVTGTHWSRGTQPGWLADWWAAISAYGGRALTPDPFFVKTIGQPKTPNGVSIPYTRSFRPIWEFEPTSIGTKVDTKVCQYPKCPGDPGKPGRLDEITFLLERCHDGTTWPWRKPATSFEADAAPEMPRLTL